MTDSATRTLVKLLEAASPDDRQLVMGWLLESLSDKMPPERPASGAEEVEFIPMRNQPWRHEDRVEFVRGTLEAGPGFQVVTIRLPHDRHAALRRWCADNRFSMASVLRGLVDRFLDAQQPGRSPKDET